ncbi:MAG: hypothetical protein MRY78_18455 [Saprospiraceae bacterium]|nr:hypothetical protein [Saprospiraceae bacterium]
MKSKEDLFHLIKAMSKSEKRYFTLDAQKTGKKGNKYLELFQAVNGMDIYDEAKLKKKFTKSLPSDKAYLYEAILRSMRDYRSSKSRVAQIKEMILDANYLYERGLYSQCEERLREAKELATELDEQLELLEINKKERLLVWNLRRSGYEKQLEQLIHENEQSLIAIRQEFKYQDAYDTLLKEVVKNPDGHDPEKKETLIDNFQHLFTEKEGLPATAQASRKYFQSAALYHQLQREYDKVFEYYSKVLDWWDQNPKLKDEEFFKYIVDISNLLFICLRQKKYELFPELIQQIEAAPPLHQHDQRTVFKRLSLYKLVYYMNSGRSEGAKELIQEIENGLETYKISIDHNLPLIANVAILAFILQDFEETIKWANRVIKTKHKENRLDVQRAMHILYLIAVYELDDLDQIDQAIRLVQRNLAKRFEGKAGIFEKTIFDYIKKLHHASLNEEKTILSEMNSNFEALQENTSPEIRKGTYGLDELIMHWLKSKTEKITILQAIQLEQQVESSNI